ncbi:MAG: P27 family phage terminase small subunit [Lewinellaceae bacterium]|nr:P27 family phage terminase small subunit [Lewinellaceae bacterium]
MARKINQKVDEDTETMYSRIVDYLTERGQLETVDLDFVRICATIGSRVKRYERLVAEHGEIETYPNGAEAPSANYKILLQERKEFVLYCHALGITPKGRQGLTGFTTKKTAKSKAIGLMKIAK